MNKASRSGFKKISLIILCCFTFCLTSCGEDVEPPNLELKEKEIVVDVDEKIDYEKLIKRAEDDEDGDIKERVKFSKIDTKKKGKKSLQISLKDDAGNETKKKIDVFVVDLFDDGSFDPRDIKAKKVKKPEDLTVLVNKFNELDATYEPDDLESIIDRQDIKLRREANEAYTDFYKEAKKRGMSIYTISAYRSYDYQRNIWNNVLHYDGSKSASRLVAYPGRSEHQLGLAIDISNLPSSSDSLTEKVGDSPLGKFIREEAYKYGFVLRYPKNKVHITRYSYEPWHMRYVGKKLAKKLYEKGWTLEEYYYNR